VLRSTNGGMTWSPQALPLARQQGSLYTVSCSSPSVCAVGGALEETGGYLVVDFTSDGGQEWRSGTLSPNETRGSVSGTSCVAATSTCFAVGQAEGTDPPQVWETNEGATWRTAGWQYGGGPARLGILRAVDCPTVSRCYAVGQASNGISAVVYSTANGGQKWQPTSLPSSAGELDSVSCPEPTLCAAVGTSRTGTAVVLTTADGELWSSP